MKPTWPAKDKSFVHNSASDMLFGFAALSWLMAWWMWLILRPTGSHASWEVVELSLMAFFLGFPIFLTYEYWNLWTGRAKTLDPQDAAVRPLTKEELWAERRLLSPLRARRTAAGAVSMVVGLPLLVMGSLGWHAPLWLATPAAYLSAIALMVLAATALSLNGRDSASAPRWLSSMLFLCATALLIYPEFWTPTVWTCFPGVNMIQPSLMH